MARKAESSPSRLTPTILIALALAAIAWWGWGRWGPIKVANTPPPNSVIVMLGDSLTAGNGASAGKRLPDQIAALIGRSIINSGVPGDESNDGLQRLDRDVLSHKPGIVIVCLGGNDILRRVSPDATFDALETIVSRIQDAGAMVVLVGVKGLPLLDSHSGRYRALARKRGCVFVPDVLADVFGKPKLMADQIHPNDAGYAIMAQRIADAMRPYL